MLLFFLDDPGDRLVIEYQHAGVIAADSFADSLLAIDRMWRSYRPGSQLGVSRMRDGSTIADFAPMIIGGGMFAYGAMSAGVTISDFVGKLSDAIKAFSGIDAAPKAQSPSLFKARDIADFLKPLADSSGRLGIKEITFSHEDEHGKTIFEVEFDQNAISSAQKKAEDDATNNASSAARMTASYAEELSVALPAVPEEQMHERVWLVLDQISRDVAKPKGRTRDKGMISEVSPSSLPLHFLRDDLKRTVLASGISPLDTRFQVDVAVTMIGGRPKSYLIMAIHRADPLALRSE